MPIHTSGSSHLSRPNPHKDVWSLFFARIDCSGKPIFKCDILHHLLLFLLTVKQWDDISKTCFMWRIVAANLVKCQQFFSIRFTFWTKLSSCSMYECFVKNLLKVLTLKSRKSTTILTIILTIDLMFGTGPDLYLKSSLF